MRTVIESGRSKSGKLVELIRLPSGKLEVRVNGRQSGPVCITEKRARNIYGWRLLDRP